MATPSDLSPALLDWIASVTAAAVSSSRRVVAGGRRLGYRIELDRTEQPTSLYLAVEPDDETSGDRASGLRLEASVFRRLGADGVLVPTVVAVHPTIDAMLMEVVEGDAAFTRLDPETQVQVARHFMQCLAAAHLVDPSKDAVAGLDPAGTGREHLVKFIERWEATYRNGPHGEEPVIEHGLAWLRSHVPQSDRPLSFIQGDTGPGNFMMADGHVTAIIDWELAHLGDPLEDLGWLSMRCAQDPFPDFPARLAEYSEASGFQLDLSAIRYYRVLAEWTIALIGHLKSRHGLGDAERGNAFVFEQLHRRLLVEAMADAEGQDLIPITPVEPVNTASTWIYDMALDQLRESVLPSLSNPFAVRRAKGIARTIKLLREVDRAGRQAEARERIALGNALCTPVEDLVSSRITLAKGIRSGAVDADVARDYAWVRVSLDNQLHGPAMGRLRDRHLDPLTKAG